MLEGHGRGLVVLTAAFALIALGLGIAALTGAFGSNQAPRPQSALPARATVPNVLGLNQSQAAAVLTVRRLPSRPSDRACLDRGSGWTGRPSVSARRFTGSTAQPGGDQPAAQVTSACRRRPHETS